NMLYSFKFLKELQYTLLDSLREENRFSKNYMHNDSGSKKLYIGLNDHHRDISVDLKEIVFVAKFEGFYNWGPIIKRKPGSNIIIKRSIIHYR
ncbi:hypothetical protein, partial [Oenococcus oeni]